MPVGAMYKLPDSGRYRDRCGVMLTTLAAMPIWARIGRTSPAERPHHRLLQWVGVLGRQCEVVWEDDVCLSERCTSFRIIGATRIEVASC